MSRDQDKTAHLDLIAAKWCEDGGFEEVLVRYRIREVIARMRGSSLLDIGCGVGSVCRAVAHRMDRVIGVDGSRHKIQLAQDLTSSPNVEYICGLFEEFNTSESFDTIVMNNILEHVDEPISLLRQVCHWLSTNGVVIITVPNADSLHKKLGLEMGVISSLYELTVGDVSKGHLRIYDRSVLVGDIEAAGLNVSYVGCLFLKPLSNAQMETLADDELFDALYEMGKELPEYCGSLLVCAERRSR